MKYWLSAADGGWVNLRQAQRVEIRQIHGTEKFGAYVWCADGAPVRLQGEWSTHEQAAEMARVLMRNMYRSVEGETE